MLPFKNHPGTALAFARDSHGRETPATLKHGATLLGISARSFKGGTYMGNNWRGSCVANFGELIGEKKMKKRLSIILILRRCLGKKTRGIKHEEN